MNSSHLTIFDPALCCSTGVCGADVDPALVRFANDVQALQKLGVKVTRYNLAQEPGEFVAQPAVRDALAADPECLPLVVVDGEIKASKQYPGRDALLGMTGIGTLTIDPFASREEE